MSDEERIYIKEDTAPVKKDRFGDPFNASADIIKSLEGLDHNFKRRAARVAQKVNSGVDDTGTKQKTPEEVNAFGYGLFDVMAPPYNLEELASYYESSYANRGAINAKVANIVGLGYHFEISNAAMAALERASSDSAKRKAQNRINALKIQMEEWLDERNDTDSFKHTLEKVFTDLEATGNGYIEIGRTVTGEIGYIGHIPATTIRVRRKRDGFVQLVGRYATFFRNFQDTSTRNPVGSDSRPNEIIHIKKYSPLNTYYGVPDMLASAEAVVGDRLAGRYNIDYFENKGVPRYIAVVKGAKLSPDAENRLFRFLQSGLRGQNHRTLYIPLPGDSPDRKVEFKMEPVENGIQDSSFSGYRKDNREDILISHIVPVSKVGGNVTASVAAALSADRTFKEQVARPAQANLEKVINRIIAEKTDLLKFKLNELSLTDENTQSQIDERYLRMKVITPNEVRTRLNLPAMEGGDEPVDLKPQQSADQRAQANNTRTRDQQRDNNEADSPATNTGRAPKGEGRQQQ